MKRRPPPEPADRVPAAAATPARGASIAVPRCSACSSCTVVLLFVLTAGRRRRQSSRRRRRDTPSHPTPDRCPIASEPPTTAPADHRRRRRPRPRPRRRGEHAAPASRPGSASRSTTFQRRALDALDAGHSVLVAAPTGSGKTLVAEYAIGLRSRAGGKAFYTTPLKALSNQKYGDLVARPRRGHGRPAHRRQLGQRRRADRRHDDRGAPQHDLRGVADARRAPRTSSSTRCTTSRTGTAARCGKRSSSTCRRGRPGVPLGDGVERRGVRGLDRDRAGRDDRDHRGAPPGRAAPPVPGGGAGRRPAPPAADVRAARAATCARTPRRRASTAAGRGPRQPAGGPQPPAHAPPGRARRAPRRAAMLPAIVFVFSRAALRPRGRAVPCRRAAADDRGRAAAAPRASRRRTSRVSTTTISRPRLRRLARRPRGRARGAPRRDGPADEGSGRGGVRGRAREGRVRDRDAVARHQHAGAVGRHREAHEVHRRAPRVPDAGGVHAAHADGPAGAGSTTSGTRSCCWSPCVPFEQVAGLASRRTYALRSSFRPTYNMAVEPRRRYPPDTAHHLLNLSFAQYRADRDVVALERQLERTRELLERQQALARRATHGDVGEYRAPGRRDATPRAAVAAQVAASRARSSRSGPATSSWIGRARREGRRARARGARRGGVRVLALTRSRQLVRLGAGDFSSPPRRSATSISPCRTRHGAAFQREAVDALRRVKAAAVATRDAGDDDARGPCERRSPSTRSRTDPERAPESAPPARSSASNATSRGSSAGCGAAPRASPGSSTACSACSSRGATSTAGSSHRRARCSPGCTPRPTCCSPSRSARGCSTTSTPPELAALVSCFTYERRGADGVAPAPPARWPIEADRRTAPRRRSALAFARRDRGRRRAPETRSPDPGFTAHVFEWARGDDLADVLDDRRAHGRRLRPPREAVHRPPPSDRRRRAGRPATRRSAREAASACHRGVVAAGLATV